MYFVSSCGLVVWPSIYGADMRSYDLLVTGLAAPIGWPTRLYANGVLVCAFWIKAYDLEDMAASLRAGIYASTALIHRSITPECVRVIVQLMPSGFFMEV